MRGGLIWRRVKYIEPIQVFLKKQAYGSVLSGLEEGGRYG